MVLIVLMMMMMMMMMTMMRRRRKRRRRRISRIIMVLDSSLQLSPIQKNNTWAAYQSKREDVTLACEMAHHGGN